MRRESGTALGTRGVLAFPLGGTLFGASVEDVAGLIEADRVTPLPMMQGGAVSGVLAFRGVMIPAIDFSAWLGVAAPVPDAPRYGMVMSRGTERFALLIPSMPRLVPGRELKESEESPADGELAESIGAVYLAGSDRIHCLRCWSIFDSVMPPVPAGDPAPGTGSSFDSISERGR